MLWPALVTAPSGVVAGLLYLRLVNRSAGGVNFATLADGLCHHWAQALDSDMRKWLGGRNADEGIEGPVTSLPLCFARTCSVLC